MNSFIDLNADFIFRHRELIDSLTNEAAALRESEIRFAQAFAALPAELATRETFELFMRDIHAAHDELNHRLLNLMQSHAGQEVETTNNRAESLQQQLNDAHDHIVQQEGQLDQAHERIHQLENQLNETHARNAQLEKQLRDSNTAYQQLQNQLGAEQWGHGQTREAKHNLEERVRNIRENYLKPLKSVQIWGQNMPFCDMVTQLLNWQDGDIDRGMSQMGDGSRQSLWDIKGQIDHAKSEISGFWNPTATHKLSEASTNIQNFANAYPAGAKDIQEARAKIGPLLGIVDENSHLSKMLKELEQICNEVQ